VGGLVTGVYRSDNVAGGNILAPQILYGNNSGSDNVFDTGTTSFSITSGTNFSDPILRDNVISGFPSATQYFNFYSTTGTTGRAGIYFWNNTGSNGGYLIARATVSGLPSPNITATSSPLYTVGTPPSINNITYRNLSFNVFFTPGTGSYPNPTTYYYSLDGGITYTNANTTTSPILINAGIGYNAIYNVGLIATNLAGNTAVSNIVVASIPYPCFLEGSKILRFYPENFSESYVPVESLRRGDLIKTVFGYKPVYAIGHKTIPNPKSDANPSNRLYKFSKKSCSDVFKDLYITGEHCTLWESVDDAKHVKVKEHMGDVYITENHYRVPAMLDDRAEPYDGEDVPVTIWHFALEHENECHNYGVWANGLLVESCSVEYLVEMANMELI